MAEHGSGSILYALVSRGAVVLAEYGSDKTDAARAAPRISRRIVEKIPGGDNRVTYSQDRHLYHILCENGIVYLAMAEESCGRRVPFGFLEDVKNRFHAQYGATARTALAYAYNTEFSRVLRQQMEYFSTNPNADAINRVKSEIAEVKNVMVENIEKVLDRGEKIELLMDKTDRLQGEASRFRGQARKLKSQMWWAKARMTMLMALAIFLVIYFIMALACGPKLHC
mmetsp:Transcript_3647/g.9151  ORF Transcript_3647/g.9151 Transcript_3647/m.9151 type:complete len:226 (-) Transcript_3647:317-994(-)